jgi:8-oxo-dGTP diphosphatase
MKTEHGIYHLGQKALLIRDGKCLILEASYHPGKWDLPGGRVNTGEEAETAFRRELAEEIGLKEFSLLGCVDYDIWERGGDKTSICLVTNVIQSEATDFPLSFEHSDLKWIAPDEIEQHDFVWPGMKRLIKKGFEFVERNGYAG